MARKRTRKLAAAAFCSMCMLAGTQANALADELLVLPEITVTANKIAEDQQKVPLSVSVINEDEVRDSGMESLDDLSARVPNLVMPTGGLPMMTFPSIRGSQSIAHSYVPSVITYIDDVPLTSTTAYDVPLYNIESIEVLRGPQGTLYGRNASGGVIKITTKKPDNEIHGQVGVEVGTHNHVKPNIALSGPIIDDKLFAGASFQFYNHRGNVWNDYTGTYVDDRRNYNGRFNLLFTPTEDWEIRLSAGMTKYNEGTFSMYSPNAFAIYDKMPGYSPDMTQGFHDMNGGTRTPRHVTSNDNGYNKTMLNDQSLSIKYNISPAWTFTSVTTRSEADIRFLVDYDFGPNLLPLWYGLASEDRNDSGMYDFGQEFRFTYDEDGVNAIIGAAYSHIDRRQRYDYYNSIGATNARDITNTYSLFSQVKVPFAERWAFTIGGRLDYYHTGAWAHAKKAGMGMQAPYSGDDTWFNVSPKVALEYSLTENNMLYASFSEGYKAGGFDSAYATPGHEKYDEEHVYSFELGSKNQFLDNRLRMNFAVFANKYNGMQVEKFTSGMSGYIDNAGNPWALGAEGEISWMVLPGLELFANVGYTHLRFDDITDDFYGSLDRNHVPYVPEWTYSVGASYRHESGFYTRVDATGATKSYLNIDNSGYIPSHTLVNARVGYEFDNNVDVYAYVNNIFDKNYDYVRSFGGAYWVATEGVNGGVGISYRF